MKKEPNQMTIRPIIFEIKKVINNFSEKRASFLPKGRKKVEKTGPGVLF
jgi:hypothetical protein